MWNNISLNNLPDVAAQLIETANPHTLWAFYGEMSAGKTTLIKAICKQLKVEDEISSPTFSLVNEYKTTDGKTIFHFDFYRIQSIEEAYDIGYEDYFFSGNICLIEWAEKIEPLLASEDVVHISIEKESEHTRRIMIS